MAAESEGFRTVDLGEIDPARSRHMWTRSSVALTDSHVVVGQWDGAITAFDRESLTTAWETDHDDSPAGLLAVDGSIIAAGRGEAGRIAAYDADGDEQWSYATAGDIGEPTSDRVFEQPYVVDCVAGDDHLFAAARRYERDGETRRWHSTVYRFGSDGSVAWRFAVDASPIALDLDASGDRLAVGYNRCMGDHDDGLVVLDSDTGEPAWRWDPGTAGDRRVGDVSFDGDRLAVTSHGDKRGYALDADDGSRQWRVDLAVETEIDGERLYAYPNHVHAAAGHVAFLTGNTYPVEGRETEGQHPHEHRLVAVNTEGSELWDADLGGFVHGVATAGSRLVVPCAQNFRVRDPAAHALRTFDLPTGETATHSFAGIPTAAAVDADSVAAVEEPIVYHDEGETRGSYAVHIDTR
ncbi:transcriptional regulator [Halonotius terrestris]|uniref:Transcriptional regulator n=1 Tax=Halonotius terrestris TaxID=2487750 RepID=A0A8J8P684_9EURY|nr:PQQ-binding-like beta-propeller repeat protein [Halonotius terrestris]TQQ79244.1 transcriptional regulator [Halonotius terrestris]